MDIPSWILIQEVFGVGLQNLHLREILSHPRIAPNNSDAGSPMSRHFEILKEHFLESKKFRTLSNRRKPSKSWGSINSISCVKRILRIEVGKTDFQYLNITSF